MSASWNEEAFNGPLLVSLDHMQTALISGHSSFKKKDHPLYYFWTPVIGITQLLTDKTRSYIVFFGAPKRFSANKYLEQLLKSSSNGSLGYILFQMSYPNVSNLPSEIP
ncbi:unnamed protein product, partial [Vitis vinifera]|uniref:Uncharacterized protein n=1 Tax=Vitis vinifera TaxID=29760 RepID=E0CNT1_VITVI